MNEHAWPQLPPLIAEALAAARKAAVVQLHYFRSGNLGVRAKVNESDIVTLADADSEKAIIDHIHAVYPDHAILSEESGDDGRAATVQWVIDPLDGTTNFASGLPSFCVSIGVRVNGEPYGGVVVAPYLREEFAAWRGGGAWLNGSPIHCSQSDRLDRAVVATGFPIDKNSSADNNLDNVGRVLPCVRGMRRLGAAALDLCYVAAGFLGAYWELNLHQWDVEAGNMIVREAGGVVDQLRPITPERNICQVAASAPIMQKIRPLLR